MIQTIINSFKVKEIRNRILFTILLLLVVRIGCLLPLPGADSAVVATILGDFSGLSFFNALTGSSFERFSIFALNVTVYITASIIVQLLTIAFPKLEEMQKDGENGRKKISKITRYLTLGLAIVESGAMCIGFGNQGVFGSIRGITYWATIIASVCILTAGAMFVTWIGEIITERGIGNGISLILLVNILSSMPLDFIHLYEQFIKGAKTIPLAFVAGFIIIAIFVGMILFIVYLNNGERNIPVQYSQKSVNSYYGAQSSAIPLKVNTAGVIPIIFAASLFQLPIIISRFVTKSSPEWTKYLTSQFWFNTGNMKYTIGFAVYLVLIVFFSYYYTQVTFNPYQVADNIRKQGGMIPGIRPGKSTEDYLKSILKYLVFIGAVALCIVATVPIVISGVFNASLSFAGTSLIIVVSVIVETWQKVESMLLGRHYSGFLTKH